MNKIKLAMTLFPVLRLLYEDGVLSVNPSLSGESDYIQITEKMFRDLFPEVEEDKDMNLITYVDGVKILAVVL